MRRALPPLTLAALTPRQRSQLRLYRGSPLARYFVARAWRRAHDDGPIEPVAPVSRL